MFKIMRQSRYIKIAKAIVDKISAFILKGGQGEH